MAEKGDFFKKMVYAVMMLGGAAGLLLLCYKYIPSFQSAANSAIGSSSKTSSGQTSDQSVTVSSTNESGDIKLGMTLARPLFQAAAGDVIQMSATLSPSNVTNKKIIWSVSDSSKVTLSSSESNSGESVSITLVTVYGGALTVTATAEADSTLTTTCKLYCANELGVMKSLSIAGCDSSNNSTYYTPIGWTDTTSSVSTWLTSSKTKTVSSSSYYSSWTLSSAQTTVDDTRRPLLSMTQDNSYTLINMRFNGKDSTRLPYLAYQYGLENNQSKLISNPSVTSVPIGSWSGHGANVNRYIFNGFELTTDGSVTGNSGFMTSDNFSVSLTAYTTDLLIQVSIKGNSTNSNGQEIAFYNENLSTSSAFPSAPSMDFLLNQYVAPSGITGLSDKAF